MFLLFFLTQLITAYAPIDQGVDVTSIIISQDTFDKTGKIITENGQRIQFAEYSTIVNKGKNIVFDFRSSAGVRYEWQSEKIPEMIRHEPVSVAKEGIVGGPESTKFTYTGTGNIRIIDFYYRSGQDISKKFRMTIRSGE